VFASLLAQKGIDSPPAADARVDAVLVKDAEDVDGGLGTHDVRCHRRIVAGATEVSDACSEDGGTVCLGRVRRRMTRVQDATGGPMKSGNWSHYKISRYVRSADVFADPAVPRQHASSPRHVQVL
jgi:hypothetical protein